MLIPPVQITVYGIHIKLIQNDIKKKRCEPVQKSDYPA